MLTIDLCFGYKTYVYFKVGSKLKRFDFSLDEPQCEGVFKGRNGVDSPCFGLDEMWLKDDVLYGLANDRSKIYSFDLELLLWKFIAKVKTGEPRVNTLVVL
jgi:hypothetical protein